jgi:phosphatidylserine/phosphatidylglycerophosphate/cardiolipin synthase-like enzyme
LLACDVTWTAVTPSATAPPVTNTAPSGTMSFTATPYTQWLQIYFTDPLAPGANNYEGGPDVPLVKAIDSARLAVDVAAYDLNLWSIRDALVHAEQRGVTVRMVMESDNMDTPEVDDLKAAGIPIVGDQREGLMHDKYIIIDRAQVWTGSMNFTAGGTYRDNNNLIRIQSVQVAENYSVDFNEMFNEDRFGNDGTANTPYPELTIDGTQVQFFFSPDDGVAAHILDLLEAATESIHFLAYSFTSDDIGQAIIAKAQAGLEVSGVVDVSQSTGQGAEYETLKGAGVDVRLDGNPRGLMHDKVIIIDRSIIITGSYNFTASAEDHNDENLVVIHNEAAAFKYMDEFTRIFNEAQP